MIQADPGHLQVHGRLPAGLVFGVHQPLGEFKVSSLDAGLPVLLDIEAVEYTVAPL